MWRTREFADAPCHSGIALVASFVKKAGVKPELMGECGNRTPSEPLSITNAEPLKEGTPVSGSDPIPAAPGLSGFVREPMADG